MDIDIRIEKYDDFSIVNVSGNIDASTSEELEKELAELIDQGENRLILDLEQTDYISSAGLRILVVITKKIYDSGHFCLCNANENVYEIIEVAGFHSFMTICVDLDEAKKKVVEE